jgi:hypothetical protein
MPIRVRLILPLLAAWAVFGQAAQERTPKIRPVIVDQGRIRVKGRDGAYLPDAKLAGAKLVGYNDAGVPVMFRIDSVMPYKDSVVDMWMYSFSAQDTSGTWVNACGPDVHGRQRGFALPGYFDATGRYMDDSGAFSITCTSGASGKCVLFGYLPWGKAKDGTPLKPYYQACGRMVRADYCGDGKPHTRNGTLIEIWDHHGIQADTHEPGLTFEASWAPDGAVWLRRTRIPAVATLDDIAKECPDKAARMRAPSDTTAAGPALLFNKSRP